MSNVENTQNEANQKAIKDAAEKLAKKGKLIFGSSDEESGVASVSILDDLIATLGGLDGEEGKPGQIKDWAAKADAEIFNTAAIAKAKNGELRLIAIANPDAVFADPVVRRFLHKAYRNRVLNCALDPEAQEAQFITVSGCFRVKYSEDAWDELAPGLVSIFKKQGAEETNKAALRSALENGNTGRSLFPKITADQWGKVFAMLKNGAEKRGLDTALFEHWEATREAVKPVELKFEFEADALETSIAEREAERAKREAKKAEKEAA